jgi:protocatechuate 3,4-dioxygenase beta subunit
MTHHDHHHHDLGLQADLQTLLQQTADRRRALRWLALGGLSLSGCGGGGDSSTTGSDTGTGTGTGTTTCSLIPEETAGPYPGDGSNTANGSIANALMLSGIVRSDIRSSVADASGTASGVPMTVTLQLVNTNGSCAALAGFAIYLWHCDALGRYSMYSSGVTAQNYLRGVQVTDANGQVTFTTIFPGCYSGRWPHMHFEVYRSETTATSYSNKLRTSQLALPQAECALVYATSGYTGSAANLRNVSLSSDGIFSDGSDTQLVDISGDTTNGFAASLEVGISV